MDFEIASLLESEMKIQEIINFFMMKTNFFSGREFIDFSKKIAISEDDAKTILYILIENGNLNLEKPGKNVLYYIFTKNSTIEDYLENQEKVVKFLKSKISTKSKEEEFSFLITYPNDINFKKIDEIDLLFPNLKRLLRDSKKEVLIINPFFDKEGIDRILYDLLFAAQRGVNIRIVSREYGVSQKLTECVDTIRNVFKEKKLNNKLLIRDYYKKEEKQIFAIHSKIILVDNISVYVGSANLTFNSFYSNLELGVIIKGKKVLQIKDVFENLWDISKKIN